MLINCLTLCIQLQSKLFNHHDQQDTVLPWKIIMKTIQPRHQLTIIESLLINISVILKM